MILSRSQQTILLAPFLPWLLALICAWWLDEAPPVVLATTNLARTFAYLGLGMHAANLLWLRELTRQDHTATPTKGVAS